MHVDVFMVFEKSEFTLDTFGAYNFLLFRVIVLLFHIHW